MNRYIMRLGCVLIMIAISFQLVSCNAIKTQQQSASDTVSHVFAMGTAFDVRVIDDNSEKIRGEIEQALYTCESVISWRRAGSLAAVFNDRHQADMSELDEVIRDALQVSSDSHGAFDMTVLPLSELWNFDQLGEAGFDVSDMQVPDKEAILTALSSVDYRELQYDVTSGALSTENPDIQLELGAIGKGYAVEKAKEIIVNSGASGGMISAGSSICVYGSKDDGSAFRIALRDPRGEAGGRLGILTVSDTTVSTSGDYERYFEKDGVRYHHILDPRTGYPADSGLIQVTIICEDSVLGDALSTACFVLGLDEGMALAEQYGVKVMFVDHDKKIWYNDQSILDSFEFEGEDSGYSLHGYNQMDS